MAHRISADSSARIIVTIVSCLTLVFLSAAIPSEAAPGVGACHGKYRWPVKTLSDRANVDLAHLDTDEVSVADLLDSVSTPAGVNHVTSPRSAVERTVYLMHVVVHEYKLENSSQTGDQDYHVVIKDINGKSDAAGESTMVSEIPDPNCVADGEGVDFAGLRKILLAQSSSLEKGWHVVDRKATIVGVLFFDVADHGNGADNKGAELHPIICLDFTMSAKCSSGPMSSTSTSRTSGGSTEAANTAGARQVSTAMYTTEASAHANCPDDSVVWVNTRSKLYHRKGSSWYGRTTLGAYMCLGNATAAGYQDAGE
jgi:hypothetical protein